MSSISIDCFNMSERFKERYGKVFKYLHLDYLGSDGWCLYLVTDTFTEYINDADINNSYEIGIWNTEDIEGLVELLGDSDFKRFYRIIY